jgi:hypothetical protein
VPIRSALELPVPRNSTATLQLLQRLVGRESHRHWCGGLIKSGKVPEFLEKMSERYPAILRNARGRSYDRTRGRAAMHMIAFPPIGSDPREPLPMLQWILISTAGSSGLADETSHDYRVAQNAMSSLSGHLTLGDYVLVYGTKKQARRVMDRRSGLERTIWHQTSTWSWRIRGQILTEIRAATHACCDELQFGFEPNTERAGSGLCGLLAAQRKRPLFAGVRNQVVDLYAAAEEIWQPHRQAWLAAHPDIARKLGPQAGRLLSTRDLTKYYLPTMSQLRMYSAPPITIRDLLLKSASGAALLDVMIGQRASQSDHNTFKRAGDYIRRGTQFAVRHKKDIE